MAWPPEVMPGLRRKQVNYGELEPEASSIVRSPLCSSLEPGPGNQGRLGDGDTERACVRACVYVGACALTTHPSRTVTSPSASSASSSSLALAPDASISSSSAAGGKAVSSLAAAGVFFFFLRAFLSFS